VAAYDRALSCLVGNVVFYRSCDIVYSRASVAVSDQFQQSRPTGMQNKMVQPKRLKYWSNELHSAALRPTSSTAGTQKKVGERKTRKYRSSETAFRTTSSTDYNK